MKKIQIGNFFWNLRKNLFGKMMAIFFVVTSCDSYSSENLISAVFEGDCSKALVELKSGSNPNVKVKVVRHEEALPLIFVSTGMADECLTRALIDAGANIDGMANLGMDDNDMFTATPLISAIRYNQYESIKLILKFNPNLNPVDDQGNSLMSHPLVQSGKSSLDKKLGKVLDRKVD